MTAQSCDVAVIGGGIAGCASAFYLARRGLSVVLLEKGEIAGEQSGRNWGFVRQQGRDPLEIPLMIECNRMWRGLDNAGHAPCTAFGQPATLLLSAQDYDGGQKCWVRFEAGNKLDIVPGSQVVLD